MSVAINLLAGERRAHTRHEWHFFLLCVRARARVCVCNEYYTLVAREK